MWRRAWRCWRKAQIESCLPLSSEIQKERFHISRACLIVNAVLKWVIYDLMLYLRRSLRSTAFALPTLLPVVPGTISRLRLDDS